MSQPETRPETELDQSRQEAARGYARIRRWLALGELALTAILLFILVFGGLSRRLVSLIDLPVVPAAAVYLAGLLVVYELLAAPLDYYSSYVLPRRYGLSLQRFTGWLRDELKSKGMALALGAGVVALVYWFISAFPRSWWLVTWGALVVVGLIIAYLAPVIIVPLFLKMKPLADSELKRRLEELARKAGIRVGGVYILELAAKSTAANAALMGIGSTRRIVLTDTLLDKYSPAEIEVIVAHELGHHCHDDIPRAMAMQAGLLLVGLYFTSLVFESAVKRLGFTSVSDVAALPVLVLILAVLSLLVAPPLNTYQRHRESAADAYALRLTGDPDSFISMMTKLTNQNLAEAEPSRWVEALMYDHPSYRHRVELARRYEPGG